MADGEAMKVAALDHLVLTVADVAVTLDFYSRVLGMERQEVRPAAGPPRMALRFGAQKINLHPAAAPFEPKAARPTPGSADLCLLSAAPLGDWLAHLAAQGVEVIEGPVARTGATGPLVSLYFRDPDGNLIEVSNRG